MTKKTKKKKLSTYYMSPVIFTKNIHKIMSVKEKQLSNLLMQ